MIDGCDREPLAKGLCAKHYVRQRRAGDPSRVGKAGRKTPADLDYWRTTFPDWSPRAQARFVRAMRMLEDAGGGTEEKQRAIKAATRSNGSVNVSKLLGIAATRYVGALGRRAR
jgi:hypothetical protein